MGMADRLKGRVAIVTGGTSGIGEACVYLFAREGARVVLAGRNRDKGENIAARVQREGGTAWFVQTDVSRDDEVRRLIEETRSRFERIDILVNNAGIGQQTPLHQMEEEEWDRVLNINLKSVFLCSRYTLPVMQAQKRGSIINMASILGLVGFPSAGAYNASKGGMRLLTRNMALDYAREGIRVNSICPGFIQTPMIEKELDEEKIKFLAGVHPLGRLGQPEEVAQAALFLASDESSFITGSDIFVDGGYTAQ
jgi:NAD(P)-dependent dehydrogenase (short-subunit alcohol dehydrogenase family)